MTINSISAKPQNQAAIKIAPKVEAGETKEVAVRSAEKNDSVAITALAKEIHKAFESSSSASSAVDIDRVAAVKKALADGSYSINAERVAKKMIQFEKHLPRDNST